MQSQNAANLQPDPASLSLDVRQAVRAMTRVLVHHRCYHPSADSATQGMARRRTALRVVGYDDRDDGLIHQIDRSH